MTAGTQCDTCRAFGPPHAPGWFVLYQYPAGEETAPSILSALFGNPSEPLTFCSVRCLAEFATARTLIEGQPAPEGPQP